MYRNWYDSIDNCQLDSFPVTWFLSPYQRRELLIFCQQKGVWTLNWGHDIVQYFVLTKQILCNKQMLWCQMKVVTFSFSIDH